MKVTLNGVSGHSAKIHAGDRWSIGPEPVLTPLPLLMGRHVLDSPNKRRWNAPLLVQVSKVTDHLALVLQRTATGNGVF